MIMHKKYFYKKKIQVSYSKYTFFYILSVCEKINTYYVGYLLYKASPNFMLSAI